MSTQLKYTRMPNQKFPKIHTSLWGSSTSSTSAYTFSVLVYLCMQKYPIDCLQTYFLDNRNVYTNKILWFRYHETLEQWNWNGYKTQFILQMQFPLYQSQLRICKRYHSEYTLPLPSACPLATLQQSTSCEQWTFHQWSPKHWRPGCALE